MKHLQLTGEDSMFVITSAGDNALHYAIAAGPKRVSACVSPSFLALSSYFRFIAWI